MPYAYTPACRRITGEGGASEATAQKFVMQATAWLHDNDNRSKFFDKYCHTPNDVMYYMPQVIAEGFKGILNPPGAEMAMLLLAHVRQANKLGWEAYIKLMEDEKNEGKILKLYKA